MLRLLRAISPSAADAVGGFLYYVVGLPLLVIFVLGAVFLVISPNLGIAPGSDGMRLGFGAIVALAFAVDVIAFARARRARRP